MVPGRGGLAPQRLHLAFSTKAISLEVRSPSLIFRYGSEGGVDPVAPDLPFSAES